ncbi:energy-coupling factor transporter ATPase [Sporolactobacillus sp. Y61]|uniref:ABC transporter ATP-binding protein n=1 Tax=Sporolactobacillus sp. Y61 TaxID=3160863 RepID=A0AAU8IBW6_9BACL
MGHLIEVRNLHFQYLHHHNGRPWILNGISFDVAAGEFVAVLGPNGCGKSTLARHLNGLLQPSSGEVLIDGMDTRDEEKKQAIRQTVGLIFQNPDNQIISTIVEEDVAFAPENLGMERSEIRRRVDEALKATGMFDYRLHTPFKLSGGQKQRIAIAGILAMRPKCIVLDEPTSMLDPKGRRDVMNTIRGLNRDYGITIILITHNMEEAALADRLILLDAGKVYREGKPQDILTQPEQLRHVKLDVPQIVELCSHLRRHGIPIPEKITSVDECATSLIASLEESHADH